MKLTPEQEEIATLYAMVGEDAIQLREEESAKIFKTNFFSYFKEEMGAGSVVKTLEKCDFSHIRQYLEERKKSTQKATAEEKQQHGLSDHRRQPAKDGQLFGGAALAVPRPRAAPQDGFGEGARSVVHDDHRCA